METQGKLKLILNISMWALIALGLITAIIVATGSTGGALDFFLFLCYFLVGACALAGLVFGLMQFGKTLGKSKAPLYGLIGFAVVVIISFALAGSEVPAEYAEKKNAPTSGDIKLASSLLLATYILGIGAIIAAAYSAVKSAFK